MSSGGALQLEEGDFIWFTSQFVILLDLLLWNFSR